jgi:hypothetical protein
MSPAAPRPWSWALSLALVVLIAAGCGGGDEPADANADPSAEAAEGAERDDAEEEPGAVARRALEACREIVERAPGVPADTKRDLIAECEAAAEDDEEAIRTAARAACDAIAAATVPSLARGPVADACKRTIPEGELR